MQLSPSKFLSLDFLIELQNWDYISAGGKEYVPSEVDALILAKEETLFEKNADSDFADYFDNYSEDTIEEIPFPTDSDLPEVVSFEIPVVEILNANWRLN